MKLKANGWFVKSYLQGAEPRTFCSLVTGFLLVTTLYAMIAAIFAWGIYTTYVFGRLFPSDVAVMALYGERSLTTAMTLVSHILMIMLLVVAIGSSLTARLIAHIENREYHKDIVYVTEKKPSRLREIWDAAYLRFVKKACVRIEYE